MNIAGSGNRAELGHRPLQSISTVRKCDVPVKANKSHLLAEHSQGTTTKQKCYVRESDVENKRFWGSKDSITERTEQCKMSTHIAVEISF